MPHNQAPLSVTLPKDITASIAVFLVALPLCLGIALASVTNTLVKASIAVVLGGRALGKLVGLGLLVTLVAGAASLLLMR